MELFVTLILLFIAATFLIGMLSTCFVIVPQASAYIIERFGKYSRTMHPGLNFRIPLVETIREKVNCQVIQLEANVSSMLADEAFVNIPVSILYWVKASDAALFVYKMEHHLVKASDAGLFAYKMEHPRAAITSWLMREVRAVTSEMTLPQMYSDRTKVRDQVMKEFEQRFTDFGVTLQDFIVDVPTVDKEIVEASNRVIASKRLKEAAAYEADAKRTLLVGEAKAESESQVLRAEGIAEARKILAAGLFESLRDASSSGLEQSEVMGMLVEMARLDAIRAASDSKGKTVIMDLRSPNAVKPTIEV